MLGFGCKVIANDSLKSKTLLQKGSTYVTFEKLLALSDIISSQLSEHLDSIAFSK
jgi:phosphoglycerate dehydrogenase-like enzyme